jgi:hypothetical protein
MNAQMNHMQYISLAALISTVYSPATEFTTCKVKKKIKTRKGRVRSKIQNPRKFPPKINYGKKDMRA